MPVQHPVIVNPANLPHLTKVKLRFPLWEYGRVLLHRTFRHELLIENRLRVIQPSIDSAIHCGVDN